MESELSSEALPERIEAVMDAIRSRYPDAGALEFVAVICNGCGHHQTVWSSELHKIAQAFVGWRLGGLGEDADFCPSCLSCEHEPLGFGIDGFVSGLSHLCPDCRRLVWWTGSSWVER